MPDADNEVKSLAVEFADAFAEAGAKGGEDPQGAEGGSPPLATQGDPQPEASRPEGEEPNIEDLLKDPNLGPKLQSWADKAASKQISAALEREREKAREQGRSEGQTLKEQEIEDRFFSGLSQEELARELAADAELAGRYARYQERTQRRQAQAANDDTGATAEVLALATEIQHWNTVLEKSPLPADVKATLSADNFKTSQNPLLEWSTAITNALVEHEVAKKVAAGTGVSREAAREEARLEMDRKLPGGLAVAGASAGSQLPDVMKNNTNRLFQDAFAK